MIVLEKKGIRRLSAFDKPLVSKQSEYMNVRPEEIEKESFSIITRELHKRKIRIPYEYAPVVLRCIQTSADYEYAGILRFSPDVIPMAHEALLSGARIITDTKMVLYGINRAAVKACKGEIHCYMEEPEIAAEARLRGLSRSAVSMERACGEALMQQGKEDPKPYVFVIGNAPAALLALDSLINEKENFRPALIIAAPVGFVNVEYAKETIQDTLDRTGIPYILSSGCKGGSNIAAAVINALFFQVKDRIPKIK